MCGIIGGFNTDIQPGLLALRHRGPDAHQIITRDSIALGHARLAIIDLDSRANQPFQYRNITLIFSGEIWNFKELRQQLVQQDGFTFQTSSDVEVFAALLSRDGTEAFRHLQGMFAAAWIDDNNQNLYLARDRFGEAPLHYSLEPYPVFASEIKALLVLAVPRDSIEALLPGHYAVVTEETFHTTCYYDAPISPIDITLEDAAGRLYAHIEQSVQERLISDVPVCALLSGGIDSACIAYFLSQHIPDLVAYTAVHDPESSDIKAARMTADFLGIELREVYIPIPTPQQMSSVIWQIEMSYKAQIEIGWPCKVLARQIQSDGFRVTFSGEGSDELWGSYSFAQKALETEDWYSYRKDLFLLQERKNFVRANKIFLAHSIECRLPFLNTALVEFALSLPRHAVQRDGEWKSVLQQAFTGILPAFVTSRPKMAFQNGLKIKHAIAESVGRPRKFYHQEYMRYFG